MAWWSGRRQRTLRRGRSGYEFRRCLRSIYEVCIVQSRGGRNGLPHNRPLAVASIGSSGIK